jgi:hypothetical protein
MERYQKMTKKKERGKISGLKKSRIHKEASILFRDKYFYIGLIILVIGLIGNSISSYYLFKRFGNSLPILHDIILDNIPYIPLYYLYNLVLVCSIGLFFFYAYKKAFKKIPYFLIILGIYQVLRAVFIILTPFGNPNIPDTGLFVKFFRYGLFPSGHTGTEFLFFLLSSGIYKKMFFVFTLIMIATLLLGRGHYTIDIFAALVFSYAVYYFGKKHMHKFIVKK